MEPSEAQEQLKWLSSNKAKAMVIHYACGDLYDSSSAVRVAHIACLRLQNRQCVGFSFIDKKEKHPTYTDDQVEKELLEDFFTFVYNNRSKRWLHWNMKSSSYGFNALENRLIALGGSPHKFDLNKMIDLSYLLKSAYGHKYAKHPKMKDIAVLNHILPRDFLLGADEAVALREGRLRDIGLSCNAKVGLFADLAALANSQKLKIRRQGWQRVKGIALWVWGAIGIGALVIGAINDWFGFIKLLHGQ